MMFGKLLFLSILLAGPMLRADTKLSASILSCVPENNDSFGTKESLKRGIYVDRLEVSIGESSAEGTVENISFIDARDPDYVSHIRGKKVFIWGNHDAGYLLKTLNVISLNSPDKVGRISAEAIRGIAKEKENLFFFTSRTPLKLLAYDLGTGRYRTAEIREYLHCVENVGVKVQESGKVMFCGTGLKSYAAEFEIPQDFCRRYNVARSGTWNLLLNSDEYVVMHSMDKNRDYISLDRASGRWSRFQADESYMIISLHGDYLVLQKPDSSESKSIAYIYDLKGGTLRALPLMPFSKIVYYSSDYLLAAQPYRLLLLENKPDEPVVRKVIEFNRAWYIDVLLRKQ